MYALVILEFLALVIGYVWKAAAWHGGMFAWMFIFHVKRDVNSKLQSLCPPLRNGALKSPYQAGYKFLILILVRIRMKICFLWVES